MSEADPGQKSAQISGSFDLSKPELTPRQFQAFDFARSGCTVQSSAVELGVGDRTIEYHRLEALKRLGLNSAADSMVGFENISVEIREPDSSSLEPVPVIIPIYDSSSSSLSPRQKDVISLAGSGLSNSQIAERLGISQHTVVQHRRRARSKLGAGTIMDAVFIAVSKREIDPEDIVPAGFDPARFRSLSPRQREVYCAIVSENGYIPYKELARRFGIKEQTFKNIAGRLFKKLGLHGRNQAEAVNIKENQAVILSS